MPINQLTEESYGMIVGSGGGGIDPDAQAFITAAGITGETQQAAIIQLVADLKGTGSTTNNTDVWSKIYAAYPMSPIDDSTITSDSTKFNLKDSRDLDAAFRITWTNTPLFSVSLGVGQNGSNNAYGNTHFIESANMVAGNNGLTFSVSDLPAGGNYYIGGSSKTSTFAHRMAFNSSWGAYSSTILINTSFSLGINTSVRRSATDFEVYRNGVSGGTSTTNASAQSTSDIFLLALSGGGGATNFFTDGYIDFAVIHDGLTANEAKDISDAISTYKTALGR